jgi:hypothetical protein
MMPTMMSKRQRRRREHWLRIQMVNFARAMRTQPSTITSSSPTADLPCWFEAGPGQGVTACCRRADGKIICSELRY